MNLIPGLAMDRADLSRLENKALETLERAITDAGGRTYGSWVSHRELLDNVGVRYGARIWELRQKGFGIARRNFKGDTRVSLYHLDHYAPDWTAPRAFQEEQGILFGEPLTGAPKSV